MTICLLYGLRKWLAIQKCEELAISLPRRKGMSRCVRGFHCGARLPVPAGGLHENIEGR